MAKRLMLAGIGMMASALLVSPAALAQQRAEVGDPNAKVCETVSQVGSRLSKKKICATKAEWAEMKRRDREVVDQAQRAANIGCSVSPALTNGPVPGC